MQGVRLLLCVPCHSTSSPLSASHLLTRLPTFLILVVADKLAYHNPWAAVIPEIAEATKDSKVVSAHGDAHH